MSKSLLRIPIAIPYSKDKGNKIGANDRRRFREGIATRFEKGQRFGFTPLIKAIIYYFSNIRNKICKVTLNEIDRYSRIKQKPYAFSSKKIQTAVTTKPGKINLCSIKI